MSDRLASDRIRLRTAAGPARRSRSAIHFAAIGAKLQRVSRLCESRDAELVALAIEAAQMETIALFLETASTYRANGMSASAAAVEALIPVYRDRIRGLVDQAAAA